MGAVVVSQTNKGLKKKSWIAPELPKEVITTVQKVTKGKVIGCGLVTSLRGRSKRRAYRVELDDGRLVKVRWFWNPARAQKIEKYLRFINHRHFPRLLAREGSTLVLEWVRGNTLSSMPCTPQLYARCGRLLASIHSLQIENGSDGASLLKNLDAHIRADAEALRFWNLISPVECTRLIARLHRDLPRAGRLVLIHGDFCGDNLVLDPRNEVYSIDNEALDLGFAEADLARALLRWGLTGEMETAFLGGYEELRPLGDFPRTRGVWELVSLIRSIKFRYRCPEGDHRPALALLARALAEPPK